MTLSRRAPAKVNLGLHVLRRRPDGYHDIETVLHRVDWTDAVTAAPADTLSMSCSDPSLPTDERNLCLRAARQLQTAFDVAAGARLHLEKNVPYGAGLGSGSSDAAATIRLLSQLWDLNPSPERLREIGGAIGADVPFFLMDDVPAAYATGRGDTLVPLSRGGEPYRLPFPLLVVVPPVEVATSRAYTRVRPNDEDRPDLRRLVHSDDLSRWRQTLVNDFEGAVLEEEPVIRAVRDDLRRAGADYVSLSGSGSAVYGVFETPEAARDARETLKAPERRLRLIMPPGVR